MKNFVKIFEIIALALVIGFFMSACDDGGGGGGGSGGNGSGKITEGGKKLVLSGQVYVGKYKDIQNGHEYVYEKYTRNLKLESVLGGTGAVTGGILNYTIGVPPDEDLVDFDDSSLKEVLLEEEGMALTDVTTSVSDVKMAILGLQTSDGGTIDRSFFTNKETATSRLESGQGVGYIYVDKAVKITGTGWEENEDVTEGGILLKYTAKVSDLNIELKKGWNAICTNFSRSWKKNGTTVIFDITMSTSTDNPSIYWVYDEDLD